MRAIRIRRATVCHVPVCDVILCAYATALSHWVPLQAPSRSVSDPRDVSKSQTKLRNVKGQELFRRGTRAPPLAVKPRELKETLRGVTISDARDDAGKSASG